MEKTKITKKWIEGQFRSVVTKLVMNLVGISANEAARRSFESLGKTVHKQRDRVCGWCLGVDCFKHCRVSDDGNHKGDQGTVSAIAVGDWTGDDLGIDVNCVHCGQSGAANINQEEVQWE